MHPVRTYLFTFFASFCIAMNVWIYFANVYTLSISFFFMTKHRTMTANIVKLSREIPT